MSTQEIEVGDIVEFSAPLNMNLRGTVERIVPVLHIRTPTSQYGNGWNRKPEDVTKVGSL